jgi:DNA-binding response OmpR family regulator
MRSERSGETTVRVLVVEDEKGLAESMRRGLVAEGFVVDVVHDGVSGLWAASEFSYDVAILDIMLPRLNGYDVLKQIRDRNIWIPVIMLTAKEFSLLSYLMRNAGSVVGKFDILTNVWDAAYQGRENVVEVYVGYLRKKIDTPYGLQTLNTVRGMGYRLDGDT